MRHILGSAACSARALELAADSAAATGADDSPDNTAERALAEAAARATPQVREVLRRYPGAPAGGNRVSVLLAELDAMLRHD